MKKKKNDGSKINIQMIDSKLHVVTRLDVRDNTTQKDIDIQKQVFDDMLMIIAQ